MDIKVLIKKISDFLTKYKYAVLILLIGLILMAIPDADHKAEENASLSTEEAVTQATIEQRLSDILCQIEGAGEVKVLLTVETGEETVYQTNEDSVSGSDSESISVDTVTITDADRNQSGLVRQVNPPVYLGAIVVCEGADSPSVQFALVDAVSKLTGLGTNRISVLKMK